MAKNLPVHKVNRKINNAWNELCADMAALSGLVSVKPNSDAFSADAGTDGYKFNLAPVVVTLPERGDHSKANLYVIITGWIAFSGESEPDGYLITENFGTKVGYFKAKKEDLEHIYGAHYDLDNSAGHPIFHSQISSQHSNVDKVQNVARLGFSDEKNYVKKILKTVRTPCAQMDAFSVLLQLAADHLIYKDCGEDVLKRFKEMTQKCEFVRGAGGSYPNLCNDQTISCFRSRHWYA